MLHVLWKVVQFFYYKDIPVRNRYYHIACSFSMLAELFLYFNCSELLIPTVALKCPNLTCNLDQQDFYVEPFSKISLDPTFIIEISKVF